MPRLSQPLRHAHRPSHRALVGSVMPPALSQAVALLAVGAIGMTALSLTTAGQRMSAETTQFPTAQGVRPDPAAAAHLRADVAERLPGLGATTAAAPAHPAAPAAHRQSPVRSAPAHARNHSAKWLPSGTGMWIYQWNRSNGGQTGSVIKRAKIVGLTHLFVRTGSSHDGFTGAGVLRAVLPAAHKAGLKVIAWDFPELDHPLADAQRLAHAAKFVLHGDYRVSAVAPDIETPAEGTSSTPGKVRAYLVALRRLLPADVPILATVPWPSAARIGHFPYPVVSAHSDALLPMAYWYNNSPAAVTAASVKFLSRYHRPVMPVGQGYDGRLDVPSLPSNNLAKQVPAFFVTAHRMGARAVSLWSWQSAPTVTWNALKSAQRLFPAR